MFCPRCGAQAPDSAVFCPQCGNNLTPTIASPQPPSGAQQAPVGIPQRPRIEDLASLGQRIGSWLIDIIAGFIPLVNWAVAIGNWIAYRRGMTLGLQLAGARIMRENGDVSGFFHTAVRAAAATLSAIPLGLGFWWAFWDPYRQTWHDKIMHTYVWKNTPELASRRGTSAQGAVIAFWVLIAAGIAAALLVAALVAAAATLGEVM